VLAHADAASARALALDSTSADAWAARGNVLFFAPQPDYVGAVSALGRAAALDSLNASVHFMRGQVLRRLGDFESAERATHAAIRVDPTFSNSYNQMALILYTARRFAPALAYSDSAIAADTANWQFREIRSRIQVARGDTVRARIDAEQSLARAPTDQREYAQMVLAQAKAAAGDTAGARTLLTPILAKIPAGRRSPRDYQQAISYIAIGEIGQALALLERIEPRGAWLWSYLVLPTFDPVRRHPRFVKVLNDSRPPGVSAVQ
jgi:tetratricopeptide (TPR) repeat protein